MIIQTMLGSVQGAVDPGGMKFNTTYNYFNGTEYALSFTNFDKTVLDNYPGIYSTLTTVQFVPAQKYMFSFQLDFITDPISYIGIANSSLNFSGPLGIDANSIGFSSTGDYVFDDNTYGTGYCNFTTQGDIIDLAVDTQNELMWIRVNGGDWNNNPTGNPVTATNGVAIGGLTNGYPALSVGGVEFYSQFTIMSNNVYSLPSGYIFLG